MSHRLPRKLSPRSLAASRALRRAQTDAERLLWAHLRDRRLLGLKFRRQHPIGPFVADFACPERGLVIELDGSQHLEQRTADAERTRSLESLGFRVLRFWNNQVLRETEAVLATILAAAHADGAG